MTVTTTQSPGVQDPLKSPMPPLAITMGDPAGIGPETVLKAWEQQRSSAITLPPFFLIGDLAYLEALANTLGLDITFAPIGAPGDAARDVAACARDALPVYPVNLACPVRFGHGDPANAPAIISAIETAATWAFEGLISAMVTNPIHKKTLYRAGFTYPGHTEFLGNLCEGLTKAPVTQVMMLAAGDLRVVPVTTHLSLRQAIENLDKDLIVSTARATIMGLKTTFGVKAPRLAVAALNPHGGEGGDLGREEIEIIAPAIADLQGLGENVQGPFPADTLFHKSAIERFDAVLCMYHDQALIPLKTHNFHEGVNVTLGLPFVRTSPDHGTAFDIAGKGRADPRSLVAALHMAQTLSRHHRFAQMQNPSSRVA